MKTVFGLFGLATFVAAFFEHVHLSYLQLRVFVSYGPSFINLFTFLD